MRSLPEHGRRKLRALATPALFRPSGPPPLPEPACSLHGALNTYDHSETPKRCVGQLSEGPKKAEHVGMCPHKERFSGHCCGPRTGFKTRRRSPLSVVTPPANLYPVVLTPPENFEERIYRNASSALDIILNPDSRGDIIWIFPLTGILRCTVNPHNRCESVCVFVPFLALCDLQVKYFLQIEHDCSTWASITSSDGNQETHPARNPADIMQTTAKDGCASRVRLASSSQPKPKQANRNPPNIWKSDASSQALN